jgi:hypothetical protein
MNVEIVIARYNEDISWINKIPSKTKITIYNKGIDDIKYPSIKLPNVGRESHTYLTHIIDNYDNLADTTIFTQGEPFFHSPNFIELVKEPQLFEPIQPLTLYYSPPFEIASNINKKIILNKGFPKDGIPPEHVIEKTKDLWINNNKIYVEYYDNDYIIFYPEYYYDHFITNFRKSLYNIFKFESMLKFAKDRYKLTNVNLKLLQPMCYAAIFSVSRDVIRTRTKSFYKNILKLLLEDKEKYNIDTGLLLERLWLIIFNYQKYNKNYKKLYIKDFQINFVDIPIFNNKFEINVNTKYELFFELNIDNLDYYFVIGDKRIYLKRTDNSFKKIFFKDNAFKFLIKQHIKIELNKKLYVYINNKLIVSFDINKIKLNSVRIEKQKNNFNIEFI